VSHFHDGRTDVLRVHALTAQLVDKYDDERIRKRRRSARGLDAVQRDTERLGDTAGRLFVPCGIDL
jgi:hypothetical protein